MATLTKRKVHGHTYYYLVESKRINGKPCLVLQKYLGRAEDVVARLEGQFGEPQNVVVSEYGGSQALLQIARRLGLVEHIDAVVPKRDQGLSVGTYVLLAVLNRVLAPASQAKLIDWYRHTALYHDFSVFDADLTSRRFWDRMGDLSAERIRALETALTRHMVEEFGLDLSTVVYHTIQVCPGLDPAPAAQSARADGQPQSRRDDQEIGLAWLATTDFAVPLLHSVYQNNHDDHGQFASIWQDLTARRQALRQDCARGQENHARANPAALEEAEVGDAGGLNFVAAWPADELPDVLETPGQDFVPVAELGDLRAYRTVREVLGVERTVVVTYSEALYWEQCQSQLRRLGQAQKRLQALEQSVRKAGRRPTVAALKRRASQIVARAGPQLGQWLIARVEGDQANPTLTYTIDHQAFHHFGAQRWGKTILLTDHDDWSTAEIVAAHKESGQVGSMFGDFQHPLWIQGSPPFRWTDEAIRVHSLIGILAVTLAQLLHRECARAGVDLSLPALLEELTTIREVAWVVSSRQRRTPWVTLTDRSLRQQQLMDHLSIPMPAAE